jgi:hypothetical protein
MGKMIPPRERRESLPTQGGSQDRHGILASYECLEQSHILLCHVLDRIVLSGTRDAGLAAALPCGLIQKSVDSGTKAWYIRGLDETAIDTIVDDGIGDSWQIRGDRNAAVGLGFLNHHTHTFEVGGKQQKMMSAQVSQYSLVGLRTEHIHLAGDLGLLEPSYQGFAIGTIADDRQMHGDLVFTAQGKERWQAENSLLMIVQTTDEEEPHRQGPIQTSVHLFRCRHGDTVWYQMHGLPPQA